MFVNPEISASHTWMTHGAARYILNVTINKHQAILLKYKHPGKKRVSVHKRNAVNISMIASTWSYGYSDNTIAF